MSSKEELEDRFYRLLMKMAIYGLFIVLFLLLITIFMKGWKILLR